MVYMGSKAALVSELGPILKSHLVSDSQWYIECFMGGGNMISMIDHPLRWGNDYNDLLPEMFSYLQSKVYFDERTCEWCFPEDTFPTEVSKEEFPKWLVAYVGFCCSFKATFFQGYAGKMYQDRNRASIFKAAHIRYAPSLPTAGSPSSATENTAAETTAAISPCGHTASDLPIRPPADL